jgi:hypothetical protein
VSAVDIMGWEHHNAVRRAGRLRVRRGLLFQLGPTPGTVFVGGFSVESPSTTEVWHYLFEQSPTTGACGVRVTTEDGFTLYTYEIGVLSAQPVFSWGTIGGQIIINSPQLSAPLYGLVGGGLTTALKQPSDNPSSVVLDIPAGHACGFGDRIAIGSGRTVFFSDPDAALDPRTYVETNAYPLDGQILDLFQGPEGALYVCTTNGIATLSADALGKGQDVTGFWSVIPGIQGARPRTAAASNGRVAVLTLDGLLLLDGEGVRDLSPYEGRRFYSPAVEVADFRIEAQLFATSSGFLVGFPGRPFALVVDLANGLDSYVGTKSGATLSVCGVLRGRDGEDLYVLRDRVVEPLGSRDFDGEQVRAVSCGQLIVPPAEAGVLRGVTLSADSAGRPALLSAGALQSTSTTAARAGDLIIGTSTWSASGNFVGRSMRSTLLRTVVRDSNPNLELATEGADRAFGNVDIDIRGQARGRRDRM